MAEQWLTVVKERLEPAAARKITSPHSANPSSPAGGGVQHIPGEVQGVVTRPPLRSEQVVHDVSSGVGQVGAGCGGPHDLRHGGEIGTGGEQGRLVDRGAPALCEAGGGQQGVAQADPAFPIGGPTALAKVLRARFGRAAKAH